MTRKRRRIEPGRLMPAPVIAVALVLLLWAVIIGGALRAVAPAAGGGEAPAVHRDDHPLPVVAEPGVAG